MTLSEGLGIAFGLLVGNVAWIGAVRDLVRGRASRGWPKVAGEIVSSERDTDAEGYGVRIAYRYEVDGRSFQGDRLRFGFVDFDRSSSQRAAVERYAPGSRVEVAVHPSDPKLATLETGNGYEPYLFLVFGLAFVAGSVAVLLR